MEKFPPGGPRATAEQQALKHYDQFVSPMMALLDDLADRNRQAYELMGGAAEYWHLDELPLDGSPNEAIAFDLALRTVQQFHGIAVAEPGDPAAQNKLVELRAVYLKAIYGDMGSRRNPTP